MATEQKNFTFVGGPDDLGLYTAFDEKGYFHVKSDGVTPLYEERYEDIEGFHEGVAVVQQDGKGFHIKPDGTPAYKQRYDGVVFRFVDGKAKVMARGPDVVLIKIEDKIFEEPL